MPFDESIAAGEDEDDGVGIGALIREERILIEGVDKDTRWYKVHIRVCFSSDLEEFISKVSARLYCDTEQIGYLNGTIIKRPCRDDNNSFFEIADQVGRNFCTPAYQFCELDGRVSRVETNLEGDEINSGGFLHIEDISVCKAYLGMDMSLRMIHETLLFLQGDWNIAVLDCYPKEAAGSEEEKRAFSGKLGRHYARIGFQQVGKNKDEWRTWYITSRTFEAFNPRSAIYRWKTKQDASSYDVYIPQLLQEPQGIDEKMVDLFLGYLNEDQDIIEDLEYIVQHKGASIDRSCLLHMFGNVKDDIISCKIKELFPTLLRLGANLNVQNIYNETPLHHAAQGHNVNYIRLLINAGAKTTILDEKGDTPIICAQKYWRSGQDIEIAIAGKYMAREAYEVNSFVESMLLLMPEDTHNLLLDDWLPPRMMKIFELEIRHFLEAILEPGENGIVLTSSGINSISDYNRSNYRFEYIHEQVIQQNSEGFHKLFLDGWGVVWLAMLNALLKGKAPTLSRVNCEIMVMDEGSISAFNYFTKQGGKIDYALDALLGITINAIRYEEDDYSFDKRIFDAEVATLQETPLDNVWDLAHIKLLEIDVSNSY